MLNFPCLYITLYFSKKGDMNSKLTDVTNDIEAYEKRFHELEKKISQMDELERKNAQDMETKINEIEESFKVSVRGLVTDVRIFFFQIYIAISIFSKYVGSFYKKKCYVFSGGKCTKRKFKPQKKIV